MEESFMMNSGAGSSSALDSKSNLDLVKPKEEAKASKDDNNSLLLKDSSDEELTKIGLMRTIVESKDPSSKEEDDLVLRIYLRARGLDVQKGSALFLKYLKWKRSFMPNGFISPSEISEHLAKCISFSQGFDKMGRPIAVTFAAKYFKGKDGVDGFILHIRREQKAEINTARRHR